MSGVAGRAGQQYERNVADYAAQTWGLPWDRQILRGASDLLDLTGTLPSGFLVGCKAKRRGTEFGAKISEAMDQCDRAMLNLNRFLPEDQWAAQSRNGNGHLIITPNGIVPVQVMQRTGYPIGKHYVVTQLDYFLDLAVRRSKWRDDE